jgi:hypothetical protein
VRHDGDTTTVWAILPAPHGSMNGQVRVLKEAG